MSIEYNTNDTNPKLIEKLMKQEKNNGQNLTLMKRQVLDRGS